MDTLAHVKGTIEPIVPSKYGGSVADVQTELGRRKLTHERYELR